MRKTVNSIVLAATLAFSGSTLAGFKSAGQSLGSDLSRVGNATIKTLSNGEVIVEGAVKTVVGVPAALITFDDAVLEDGVKKLGKGAVGVAKDTYSLAKAVTKTAYNALMVLDENTAAYNFWSTVLEKIDYTFSSVDNSGFKFTADKLDELFNDDPVMAFVVTSTLRSMGDAVKTTWGAASTLTIKAPFKIAQSLVQEIYILGKGLLTGQYKNPMQLIKAIGNGVFNFATVIVNQAVRVFKSVLRAIVDIAEIFVGEGGAKIVQALTLIGKPFVSLDKWLQKTFSKSKRRVPAPRNSKR